jgi:Fe-S cluster assembly scaffold protein SufB
MVNLGSLIYNLGYDGNYSKSSINVTNNLIESIKILVLNNEESVCIPNLLVSSNEVEVNHAATISCIDPNYLFYLNSKGISNESATKLIKNGYLLNNLNINSEIKEKINEL